MADRAARAAQLARERLQRIYGTSLGTLIAGLAAPDHGTRRMSRLFFACSLGAILVVVAGIQHFKTRGEPRGAARSIATDDVGEHLGEFLNKQTEEAKLRAVLLNLGEFTAALKRGPDDRPVKGVLNMAEFELVVECDTRETCEYVEAYVVQARNLVTNALIGLDREALLSREGKKRLKKALADRMNAWLPKGKIENLYFSRLVVG